MNYEIKVQMSALNLWKNKSSERNSEKVVSPAAVTDVWPVFVLF